MPPAAVATPKILVDPGYLFIAPLSSAVPSHTATAGVFSDSWPVAWIPLGATEAGSEFSYSTTVESISVAEFFDPIRKATVSREGSFAFNLASWTLTNYRRALNGGVAALTTTGAAGSERATLTPPTPGSEVRAMIGWESLDNTLRIICHQTIQGGEITSAFAKAPAFATIPCTFELEVPSSGIPWNMETAGLTRV